MRAVLAVGPVGKQPAAQALVTPDLIQGDGIRGLLAKSQPIIAALTLLTLTTPAQASLTGGLLQNICRVTDPTGTPLNIRAAPNGKIISNLANETVVVVQKTGKDAKGRVWAFIKSSGTKPVYGWIFRDFVTCVKE